VLIDRAFTGAANLGLRENLGVWIGLRNCVAHRHLPTLDYTVMPHAQATLMNFERVIVDEFGAEYALAERLSVPLQLQGFRDPDVLASRKNLQSSLPLDVQHLLARPEQDNPALTTDDTFMLRVLFMPFVPASEKSPDAVAYFVKPGEVTEAMAESIEQYMVLPKGFATKHSLLPMEVIRQVSQRTGWKFDTNLHAAEGRNLGARSPKGEPNATVDIRFANYDTAFKQYAYTPQWVEHLCKVISTAEGFRKATGKHPRPLDQAPPTP